MTERYHSNGSTNDSVKDLLLRYYGIAAIDGINNIPGKQSYLIRRSSQTHVLKFHHPLMLPNLQQLRRVYERMSDSGMCPPIVRTKDQEILGISGGRVYSLHQHVENTPLTMDLLDRFCERLVQLHNELRGIRIGKLENHFVRRLIDIEAAANSYGYGYLVPVLEWVNMRMQEVPLQIVHGDLHAGNVIFSGREIFFIDFDSALTSVPDWDVGFAAFRCFGREIKTAEQVAERYNAFNPSASLTFQDIVKFSVYNILQRILFILVERDDGNPQWMYDLDNQKSYLKGALESLS